MSAPVPPLRPGAVALVSGGLDSAVMIARALAEGDVIWPLYVRQGFVWEDEEARSIARFLDALGAAPPGRIQPLQTAAMSVPAAFTSAWAMDVKLPAPAFDSPDEAVYLPGRNLALLTQAASLAFSVGVRRLMLGILSGNPFPDSRPEFFRAFEAAARAATGWDVRVEAPLAGMSKRDALQADGGWPLELTLSCIRPLNGRHCGACNKCAERRRAFAEAGVADPTDYRA